jgi:LacI family transcriptional regulator, galactose operon repressor
MNRQVGIRDVAAEAGVSVTTVSHVLNDTPHTRTSDETKRRVREAAERLGYGPNRMAQGLRTQRSHLLGLLSEEIATTPHAGRIILGAEETARALGFTLVIINAERAADEERRRADVGALIDRQVDGMLYATMFHRVIDVPANAAEIATVLIDAQDRGGAHPSVVPDEVGGAVVAVRHLIGAGHRRIGFVTNDDDVPATHGRLEGYRSVLAEAGIEFDPGLVEARPSETMGGYEAASVLLDRPDRPTAIFAYNDRMAMGVYRAAQERGLSIPGDLSVVGFDNQELIAANLFPGLTTVALPHYEMGRWAVETLVGLIDGRAEHRLLTGHPTLLPCPLVERASVASPRNDPNEKGR